jgi:hypothetical protein
MKWIDGNLWLLED